MKFILSCAMSAAIIGSRGFAAVLLWHWFVVPTFHLPELTWRVAYGLALVLSVLHAAPEPEYEKDSWQARMVRLFSSGIVEPWICVAIGWILK